MKEMLPQPKFRYTNETVGLFVLVSVLIFVAGMLYSGQVRKWFNPGETLRVVLPDDCYHGVSELALSGERKGQWQLRRLAVEDTTGWIAAAVIFLVVTAHHIETVPEPAVAFYLCNAAFYMVLHPGEFFLVQRSLFQHQGGIKVQHAKVVQEYSLDQVSDPGS